MDPLIWVAAVPLPFLGWRRVRCGVCRKRFKSGTLDYERHYIAEHLDHKGPQTETEMKLSEALSLGYKIVVS